MPSIEGGVAAVTTLNCLDVGAKRVRRYGVTSLHEKVCLDIKCFKRNIVQSEYEVKGTPIILDPKEVSVYLYIASRIMIPLTVAIEAPNGLSRT